MAEHTKRQEIWRRIRCRSHNINPSFMIVGALLITTLLSGAILTSVKVSADDPTVENVSVTVSTFCTMTGTGTNHTATTVNGIVYSGTDLGITTLKAFCNDSDGFAIYAIGFTDDEDGKNVLTSSTLGSSYDIQTGTNTTGNSSWAFKMGTVSSPTPTYPIIIAGSTDDTLKQAGDVDYSGYAEIPDEYAKVAYRTASTDVGSGAEGSTLTADYQVFIGNTQPAGTYVGQVKYVLVHPSTGDEPVKSDQIAVNYDGNGLLFANSATKNKVVYGSTCTPMYQGTTPTVVKTSNIASDGTQNGAYTDSEEVLQPVSFAGASKVKVVIDYGITADTMGVEIVEGDWDGNWDNLPSNYYEIYSSDDNLTGTNTYTINGDTVTLYTMSFGTPESDYDYGMYARVYPIYATEQSGTEEISVCSYGAINGTYTTTTTWKGKWFMTVNGETTWFTDESAVANYLAENDSTLLGTTLTVYAYNPYTIIYNGNNATAGTMSNFTTSVDTMSSTADLMAPNFYKTNYGFAGWSENSSATVNGSDTIYGPNEKITGSDLTFDSSTHQTTLYAVWVPTSGTMQSFSCSSLNSGQVTALTDSRDSNVYTVGKMQDGNCWMMENLRLESANSSDSTKAQGFGGVFTGLATAETANFGSTTANSLYSTSNITGSYQSYRFPRYNNLNTQMSNNSLTATPGLWNGNYWDDDQYNNGGEGSTYKWYGYGNYYSWAAAIANTTAYNSNNAGVASASTSICPSGWQLPIGGQTNNTKSFSYLDTQMGGTGSGQGDNDGEEIVSNRWRSYPNNFVYSGYWNGSSAFNRGGSGYYWSSSAYNSDNAYSLYFNSTYVYPGTDNVSKFYGNSVRCVAGS